MAYFVYVLRKYLPPLPECGVCVVSYQFEFPSDLRSFISAGGTINWFYPVDLHGSTYARYL